MVLFVENPRPLSPRGPPDFLSTCLGIDSQDVGSIHGLGRSPGVGNGNPTPVFLPGESHGQRSLVGYSPCSHKESDMTELFTLTKYSSTSEMTDIQLSRLTRKKLYMNNLPFLSGLCV